MYIQSTFRCENTKHTKLFIEVHHTHLVLSELHLGGRAGEGVSEVVHLIQDSLVQAGRNVRKNGLHPLVQGRQLHVACVLCRSGSGNRCEEVKSGKNSTNLK